MTINNSRVTPKEDSLYTEMSTGPWRVFAPAALIIVLLVGGIFWGLFMFHGLEQEKRMAGTKKAQGHIPSTIPTKDMPTIAMKDMPSATATQGAKTKAEKLEIICDKTHTETSTVTEKAATLTVAAPIATVTSTVSQSLAVVSTVTSTISVTTTNTTCDQVKPTAPPTATTASKEQTFVCASVPTAATASPAIDHIVAIQKDSSILRHPSAIHRLSSVMKSAGKTKLYHPDHPEDAIPSQLQHPTKEEVKHFQDVLGNKHAVHLLKTITEYPTHEARMFLIQRHQVALNNVYNPLPTHPESGIPILHVPPPIYHQNTHYFHGFNQISETAMREYFGKRFKCWKDVPASVALDPRYYGEQREVLVEIPKDPVTGRRGVLTKTSKVVFCVKAS